MSGFADYHAHFVYGVDDGAQTCQEMYVMLDAAAADGVTRLYATSHCMPGLEPFPQAVYERHLRDAQDYCAQKGYPMTLYAGGEILYTPAVAYAAAAHALPVLGTSRWILLEFVPDITAGELETALEQLSGRGYRMMLAHVERYACLAKGGLLRQLREQYPIRCQVNCSTVLQKDFWVRRRLNRWLREGVVDAVSSDAHNCGTRPTRMREAYRELCARVGQSEADRLTENDGADLLR